MEIRFDLAVSAEHGVDAKLADAMLLIAARSADDGGTVYLAELERILQAMFGDLASLGQLDPVDLASLVNRVAGLVHALACTAYAMPIVTRQLEAFDPEDAMPFQTILRVAEQSLEALVARGDDPAPSA